MITTLVAALIVALGLVDVWLTTLILEEGGREANPLMKKLQDLLPKGWGTVKVAIHTAVAIAILNVPSFIFGGYLFVIMYVIICIWNLRVLRRLTDV